MREAVGKVVLLGIGLLACALTVHAGPPDVIWSKTYGGSAEDRGSAVQQTTDGGYVVAGSTMSFRPGFWDIYLIKTDAAGDTLWTRTYGGSESQEAYSVKQTPDGGYVIGGWTSLSGADPGNICLIRTDESGDTLWTRSYGGPDMEGGGDVQLTPDGGFILGGGTYSGTTDEDIFVVKTDANGAAVWQRTYGDSSENQGAFIEPTNDGGYLVLGTASPTGVQNPYLVKINASGDTLWSRVYVEPENDKLCFSVRQTADGGYVLAGVVTTPDFMMHAHLIKTDANAETSWTRTYGYGYATTVRQLSDGGYMMSATVYDPISGGDACLIRTDSHGDTLWTRPYGGEGGDECGSMATTTDGGYVLVGSTWSFGMGESDIWLVKFGPESGVEERPPGNAIAFTGPIPNPFRDRVALTYHLTGDYHVRIVVYDAVGREVNTLVNGTAHAGSHTVNWNGRDYQGRRVPRGVYLVKATIPGASTTQKLLLVR